jgi:hypothetical protein
MKEVNNIHLGTPSIRKDADLDDQHVVCRTKQDETLMGLQIK